MSETPNQNPAAPEGPQPGGPDAQDAPRLRVLAQYLKDHSFENPKAPASFTNDGTAPKMEVNVDVNARQLGTNQYEVELTVSARARRGDEISFVIDTTYAGAFEIANIPAEQLEPVLLVECPRLLFPFARQIIADTTNAGNFPPLMLEPIDFFAIYQQRVQQANVQAEAQAAAGGAENDGASGGAAHA